MSLKCEGDAEFVSKGFLPDLEGKKFVHGDEAIDAQILRVCEEVCAITDVDKAIDHVRCRLAGKIPDGNLALLEHVVRTRIEGYKAGRGQIVRGLDTFVFGGF